jgi:hypothetical protein
VFVLMMLTILKSAIFHPVTPTHATVFYICDHFTAGKKKIAVRRESSLNPANFLRIILYHILSYLIKYSNPCFIKYKITYFIDHVNSSFMRKKNFVLLNVRIPVL